ncbi:ABC transporter permease [Pseudoalteromonas rubra]|uniref:ABC transporter permease n=1 Tax=Pseudoalteromonas rubra TaxID=43658 RepID=UPI000F7A551B|nr:ABC transporter permease [Pseudoalteromonas rubra]
MRNKRFYLTQAIHSLRLRLGFVGSVTVTLGVTLGTLLAVLTLSYYIVWQALPYPEQEQIIKLDYQRVDQNNEIQSTKYLYPAAVEMYKTSRQEQSVALMALSRYGQEVLVSQQNQPKVNTIYVTPEWFSIFGAKAVLGRFFSEDEGIDNFVPGAVISYATWKALFNGDSNVLEQSVMVNGKSHPIVGVLDKNFVEPEVYQIGRKNQVWLPWDFNNSDYQGYWGLADNEIVVMAKTHPQAMPNQVAMALSLNADELFQQSTTGMSNAQNFRVNLAAESIQQVISQNSYGTIILLLAGGFGLVAIAITNIANLMMARTVAQLKKLSIAAALGAKKKHLFYTLLAESSVLVCLSLLLAQLIAFSTLMLVKQYCAEWIPRTEELQLNWFSALMAVLLAVVLALVFAWLNSRLINYSELKSAIQSSGKGTGAQISKKSRNLLIGCQISVATLLVCISTALMIDSQKQLNKQLGIDTEQLMFMEFSIATLDWKGWGHYVPDVKRLQDNLMGFAEVQSMSFARSPLDDLHQFPVKDVQTNQDYFPFHRNVDQHYFDVTGQTVLLGRGFSKEDIEQSAPVVIVNQVFAKQLAASYEEAIGKKVTVEGSKPLEIVGIVQDLHLPNKHEVPARFYVPNNGSGMWALIKLAPNQHFDRAQMIAQLSQVNSQFVLTKYESVDESLFNANFNTLFTLVASAALALLTIVLASIGLFGILSYSTQIRRVEICTRMAIGAKQKTIIAMVIKDNLGVVSAGLVIGTIVCIAFFNLFGEDIFSATLIAYLPAIFMTTVAISVLVIIASYTPLKHFFKQPITLGLRGL